MANDVIEFNRETIEEYRSLLSNIMPILRGGDNLWHRTSVANLQSILTEGIRPNDGSLNHTYGVSKNSLGTKLGGVCLFDFDTFSLDEVLYSAMNWYQFLTDQGSATVWIRLRKDILIREDLILPGEINYESMETKSDVFGSYIPMFIPYVEGWYKSNVPTQSFLDFLIIKKSSDHTHQIVKYDAETIEKIENLKKIWDEDIQKAPKSSLARILLGEE